MNMILFESRQNLRGQMKVNYTDWMHVHGREAYCLQITIRSSSYTEIMLMVLYLCIYLIATRDENRENDIFFQFAAVCCLLVFCFLLGHTMGNSCLSHFKFSFLFLASADKLGFKH